MSAKTQRREHVQEAIIAWILAGGDDEKVEAFRQQFADVPRRTFYRWLKEARLAAGNRTPAPAVVRARELAREQAPEKAAELVGTLMPHPVTPNSISPVGNVTAIEMVKECITHARKAMEHALRPDGKIANAKLYLAASAHQRASIETLNKISERLNDAAKIEHIQAAIIGEIRKESPETAERILRRIESILAAWGF